ncbi:MAG: peptide ABC transporter substrate-binding protein [Curvibacter sp. GWA2_64_110]|nr:MAG: peptide ABC transporter substrate-binding protein [Curvibacter sp. GWA2_64_110]HCY15409.1 ABC transporter substrate-binding protein [Curvibacter sp.]
MRICCFLVSLISLICAVPAWAGHAYAQFGDIKYSAGFNHFDYVNPAAPKGGEISLVPPTAQTQYDKYNPFTLKGTPPPGLSSLVFESLLTSTLDEPTTAYGLLAQDVTVAPDKLSAIFTLNPLARFHNGEPVLAADVKHSFDQLTSKEAAPQYRTYFGEIRGVTVLGERVVRFDFRRVNAELPLIAGSLPVFSRKWGMDNGKVKPLDQIVTDTPIGSGPYRIGKVNFGKDITYERDPTYWAHDLNVRRGLFNFDRITYKIYKDSTARLEAFKAGEFDFIQAFIAREWARAYKGKAFDKGQLIKQELKHGNASDFQGFLFNLRRDKFKDVRVREAIELAMDYEWMNRQLFYNAYTRVRGYFTGSDFEAKGKPGPEELAVLAPLHRQLPPEVFTDEVPLPPTTSLDQASGHTLRDNLRRARDLLTQAGWTYRDGALRNDKDAAFTIEFLDNQGTMGRVVTPYARNLQKLGIAVTYKTIDSALLQKRMDVFDFDLISYRLLGSEAPGTELLERYGSKAADAEGSSNFIGIKSPAVDALLDQVISAQTRPQLVARLRALDRVLRHGHYAVPHWYGSVHRVAWRAGRFEQPTVTPRYYQPEGWVTSVWWASASNRAQAAQEAQEAR